MIIGETGGSYDYDRVGSSQKEELSIHLPAVMLNTLLFVQPDKIGELLDSPMFVESGLAARMPIYMADFDPQKLLRGITGRKINQALFEPYYDVCHELTTIVNQQTIEFTPELTQVWREFMAELADAEGFGVPCIWNDVDALVAALSHARNLVVPERAGKMPDGMRVSWLEAIEQLMV